MTNFKKIFVLIIIAMALVVAATIGSAKAFAEINDNGYAVPESSLIMQTLSEGKDNSIRLSEIESEDVIYQRMGKYYISNSNGKQLVDINYPIWVNDGGGLYFFDDEKWLITDELDILCSYEGLYLTEGHTFNRDLTQADPDEFILLSLNNGLYMNAEKAIFKNELGETPIQSNSIILFSPDYIRWYSLKDGVMELNSVESVFNAKLYIGDHEYDYADFIKALDLVGEVISDSDKSGFNDNKLNQAEQIIGHVINPIHNAHSTDDLDSENSEITDVTIPETGQSDVEGQGEDGDKGSGNKGNHEADVEGEGGNGSGSDATEGQGDDGEDHPEEGEQGDAESPEEGDEGSPDYDDDAEDHGGDTGAGGGQSRPRPYVEPKVTLEDFDLWSYAFNGQLKIKDPSRAIQRGVRVAIYRGISPKGDKGRGAITRRTFRQSQEITLSPLPPGTDAYIQCTYRYIEEVPKKDDKGNVMVDEEGRVIKERIKKTWASDLNDEKYHIHIPENSSVSISKLDTNWEAKFAPSSSGIEIDNFSIKNTSNYNPEDDSFDNFKLNTLPYINRIKLTLKPSVPFKETKEMTISSSMIRKAAQNPVNGIVLKSPALDSNTKYTYSAEGFDRYGNVIPMDVNGAFYTGFSDTVYTAKANPSLKIVQVKNVTDELTLKIIISDPDGSLKAKDNLIFNIEEYNGPMAVIQGHWKDGSEITDFTDLENTQMILSNPTDGKEYEFTIDSLAFAQAYNMSVFGNIDTTPDSAPDGNRLPSFDDVLLGRQRVFTASLSSGHINFLSSYSGITDTKSNIKFTMGTKSTLPIFPLVDEFRISISEIGSNDALYSYTMKLDELDTFDHDFKYDDDEKGLILQEGNSLDPRIVLEGEESLFNLRTPWQSLFVEEIHNEDDDKVTYSTPANIRIYFPNNSFNSSTNYQVKIQSIVIKSGKEYEIPTTLSNANFVTKKIYPNLKYDDIFVAGSILEFMDLQILDKDETIQESGIVDVLLYYGDTLLSTQQIKASKLEDDSKVNLHFDNLISDGEYTVKFVARAFNDSEGFSDYKTNFTLWTYNIKGGSSLNGDLNLTALDYSDFFNKEMKPFVTLNGEEVKSRISGTDDGTITDGYKKWNKYGSYNSVRRTEFFKLDSDAKYLFADGSYYDPDTAEYKSFLINYYDENKKYITHYSTYLPRCSGMMAFVVPEGAEYASFNLDITQYILEYGLNVKYLTEDDIQIMDHFNYQKTVTLDTTYGKEVSQTNTHLSDFVSVSQGQKYFVNNRSRVAANLRIYLFNESKQFKGTFTIDHNEIFTIPQGINYVRYAVYDGGYEKDGHELNIYKFSEADEKSNFTAHVDASVFDKKGYLEDNPFVNVNLYASDSVENINYLPDPVASFKLNLVKLDDGSYVVSKDDSHLVFNDLKPNTSYKMTLNASYKGTNVELDKILFTTDSSYETIANNYDFRKIVDNPYGNFIVVSDFKHYLNTAPSIYGTVDFQGHTVTADYDAFIKRGSTNGYLFTNLNRGSCVKNLNYVFPKPSEEHPEAFPISMFNYINGTAENIIVKNEGIIDSKDMRSHRPMIAVGVEFNGTLRNFIFTFDSDIYFEPIYNSGANASLLLHINSGLIENGYIYSTNNAGFISLPHNDTSYGSLFLAYAYSWGTVRNIYSVFDSWFYYDKNEPTGQALIKNAWSFNNIYHVGDFYQYDGGLKNTSTPMSVPHIFGTAAWEGSSSVIHDLYYVSLNDYAPCPLEKVNALKKASMESLYDKEWQQAVIGDAFDIDTTIPMGFYPRLNMPDCMQKNQGYFHLPLLEKDKPTIIDDKIAVGEEAYSDERSLNVVFKMFNPKNAEIKSFDISGLSCNKIIRQGVDQDGNYEVLANLVIDENKPNYTSNYQINSITYEDGPSTKKNFVNYITREVEFYKLINDYHDWGDINKHMSWNYRLANDIDFGQGNLSQAAIMINGSKTNMATSTSFTGKLDGDNHKLLNINFENTSYPYVFYAISYGNGKKGMIKNLIIDNMNFTTSGDYQYSGSGFVRYLAMGTIDNVHVINSHITAMNNCGFIAANVESINPVIQNCSVSDSSIDDFSGSSRLRIGGIAGSCNYLKLSNSYVQDIDIDINNSSNVDGVGGLVGYTSRYSIIENSYATGTIDGKLDNVGGLVGYRIHEDSEVRVDHCYSNVTINVDGNNVGGIFGDTNSGLINTLAVGDIFATGNHVSRIHGYIPDDKVARVMKLSDTFAYSGQKVNDIKNTDFSDASHLLNVNQMNDKFVWIDQIKMGNQFDYSPIAEGNFPLIKKSDSDEILWGQKLVPLPSGNENFKLTTSEAKYVASSQKYIFTLLFEHKGVSHETIAGLYHENSLDGLNLQIDGVSLTQADIVSKKVSLELNPGFKDETTIVSGEFPFDCFEKMFDVYNASLSFNLGDEEVNALTVIDFGKINYWHVPDQKTWDLLMLEHGKNYENFLIEGMIDFKNIGIKYNELLIGRLEGTGPDKSGFINVDYVSNELNQNWIKEVTSPIKNLKFSNIKNDLSYAELSRSGSGVITYAAGIENCDISDLLIACNKNSATQVGFISKIKGSAIDVSISDVRIVKEDFSYHTGMGSLAGSIEGDLINIDVKNIDIDAIGQNTVGGLVGSQFSNSYEANKDGKIIARNIKVIGSRYVGGISGGGLYRAEIDADGIYAEARQTKYATACGAYGIARYNRNSFTKPIRVKNVTVIETGVYGGGSDNRASAVFGYSRYGTNLYDVQVEKADVSGTHFVGGIYAYTSGNRLYNVSVIDSKFSAKHYTNDQTLTSAAGAIVGYKNTYLNDYFNITVRNTEVYADDFAGSIVGTTAESGSNITAKNIYVAEDVNVTSKFGFAGGFAGSAYRLDLSNSAIGSKVNSEEGGSGGLIGTINASSSTASYPIILNNIYISNEVSGLNYVGGIFGKVMIEDKSLEPENFNNIIINSNVHGEGEYTSIWGNSSKNYGNIGDMNIYVTDNSLIQGESVKDRADLDSRLNIDSYILPKSGKIIPGSSLKNEKTYTDLGFSTEDWYFDHLSEEDNVFMPYVKYTSTKNTPDYVSELKVLLNSNYKIVDGNKIPAGILLPDIKANPNEFVVYMSDVDKVNIETISPNTMVTIKLIDPNNSTVKYEKICESDDNGIVTFGYNFVDDLCINDIVYKAEDLSRVILTYKDMWYYIDDNRQICYGNDSGSIYDKIKEIDHIVNLANGCALSSNGNYYDLTNFEPHQATQGQVKSQGFYNFKQKVRGKEIPVNTYYNFSIYGGQKVDYRLYLYHDNFAPDDELYTVSPHQDAVYDGVMLDIFGSEPRFKFFTLLGEDHKIRNYLTPLRLSIMDPNNIQYISNSFNSHVPVLLAKYDDGIVGVNFRSGKLLVNTRPKTVSFFSYARNTLGSLFGLKGFNINDDSFLLSEGQEDGAYTNNDGLINQDNKEIGISDEKGGFVDNDEAIYDGNSSDENNQINSEVIDSDSLDVSTENFEKGDNESEQNDSLKTLIESFGDKVTLFNSETGRYEAYDSEMIVKGNDVLKSNENSNESADKENEIADENADIDDQDQLNINENFKHVLENSERHGFALLATIGLLTILILGIIYLIMIKKRKK